jgi:hypothetical protein
MLCGSVGLLLSLTGLPTILCLLVVNKGNHAKTETVACRTLRLGSVLLARRQQAHANDESRQKTVSEHFHGALPTDVNAEILRFANAWNIGPGAIGRNPLIRRSPRMEGYKPGILSGEKPW